MRHHRDEPAAPTRRGRDLRPQRSVLRALFGRARRGEEGFTLLAVIGVMAVGLLLTTTVLAVSLQSTRSASAGRGTAQAQAAAEAGVNAGDAALLALDRTTQASFTCAPPATTVYGSPGASTVTSTFAFYSVDSSHLAGATPVTCPLVNGQNYLTAIVTSVAVYQSGSVSETRTMKGIVDLVSNTVVTTTPTTSTSVVTSTGSPTTVTSTSTGTSTSGGTTPYAFYGAGVSAISNFTVSPSSATTVFTGASPQFNCSSGQSLGNLVLSGGGVTLSSNNCSASSIWATGSVNAQNGGTVTGNLWSSGGSLTLGSNPGAYVRVGGSIKASGSVSWYPGCTPANNCTAGTSVSAPSVTAPPVFSTSASDLAAWANAGYTDQRAVDCSTGDQYSRGTTVATLMASSGTGDLLVTSTCDITFQNTPTISLSRNVVFLTSGSVTGASAVNITSSSSTTRNLYLIGYGGSSNFTFNNGFTASSTLATYLQAPALNVGQVSLYGQVYGTSSGGNINSANLRFVQVPLYGATNLTGGSATTSVSTSVITPTTTSTVTSTSTATSTATSSSYDKSKLRAVDDAPNADECCSGRRSRRHRVADRVVPQRRHLARAPR